MYNCIYCLQIENVNFFIITELALMQPEMIDLMDRQPQNKELQEYNKWTTEVISAAQQSVNDPGIFRDISACAMYLNVSNAFHLSCKEVVKQF